jgi:Fe2+ transport protein
MRNTISLVAVAAFAAFWLWSPGLAMAQSAVPKIKKLAPPGDPMKKAILIGRVTTERLILQLELEGAEAMWMQMGNPPTWGVHTPSKDERYHVEFKLTDPLSKTRVPYAGIVFKATNIETGKSMELPLDPMWGASGLHYSGNSALLGDGAYASTVTVAVPTFQREVKDKDLWSKPVTAKFHFRLKDGKLTEVSEVGRP